MKKLFLVTVETAGGVRTAYRLSACNHTAAGDRAKAIAKRSGINIRVVAIGELE
jgi:hypothetical protein